MAQMRVISCGKAHGTLVARVPRVLRPLTSGFGLRAGVQGSAR